MLWSPLLSAPLPLPGPRRGERTGLGSGLRLHDCVQCEEMVHLLIKMLRVWTRRGHGGHHHPGYGSGLSKRRWAHRAHLGQLCPQRASGRARALHDVFREGGLAMNSPCALVWGCVNFSFTSPCGNACAPPSRLPALCWAIRSGTLGKPTCVHAILMQTQREAGTHPTHGEGPVPLPWCRLHELAVCVSNTA